MIIKKTIKIIKTKNSNFKNIKRYTGHQTSLLKNKMGMLLKKKIYGITTLSRVSSPILNITLTKGYISTPW
jgi:hypothetical protein